SVDAYQREIKINGWEQDAHLDLFDFVQQIESLPLGGIIYTDISKDGRLSGPNFEITTQLVEATQKPVIASGGIRHQQDLELLEKSGVYAAIVDDECHQDRKSTRMNSSHVSISYAVFCMKNNNKSSQRR